MEYFGNKENLFTLYLNCLDKFELKFKFFFFNFDKRMLIINITILRMYSLHIAFGKKYKCKSILQKDINIQLFNLTMKNGVKTNKLP